MKPLVDKHNETHGRDEQVKYNQVTRKIYLKKQSKGKALGRTKRGGEDTDDGDNEEEDADGGIHTPVVPPFKVAGRPKGTKKKDYEFQEFVAGKFKDTLTVLLNDVLQKKWAAAKATGVVGDDIDSAAIPLLANGDEDEEESGRKAFERIKAAVFASFEGKYPTFAHKISICNCNHRHYKIKDIIVLLYYSNMHLYRNISRLLKQQ